MGAGGRVTARGALPRPLVAAQIAFSVCVLFLAGLLLTSFVRLSQVELGFSADRLLLVSVEATDLKEPEQRTAAASLLLDRVRALPGVEAASLSAWPIFSQGGWTNSVRIPGKPPDPLEIVHLEVSPGFFATMKIAVLDGRELNAHDVAAGPADVLSIVVNEAFVRRYFDGGAAVGRSVERGSQQGVVRQAIVGVVRNAIYNDPREAAPPTVYLPRRGGFGVLQVRTSGPPLALADAVRRAVRETHPAIVINSVELQSTLVDNALLRERLLALLSAFFAIAGVILTAVGVYGVLSYSVIRRTREIGVRMALGARRASIVGSLLREMSLVTLIGIVEGLVCGLWLARWVTSLLFGVTPFAVTSLALPIAAIVIAAALAAFAPSMRASRVDPIVALRNE
jgi:predicted permease